jgi:hypothetical protein
MTTLMRVEFSRSLRPNSPRFVLLIEIPDSAVTELNAKKVSLETRAYEVAIETAQADQSHKPEYHMSLMSCTKGKIKNLKSLGEPNFVAHDACRAWVIKKPTPLQDLLDQRWRTAPKNPGFKV